jgi:hypothetical protein
MKTVIEDQIQVVYLYDYRDFDSQLTGKSLLSVAINDLDSKTRS